MLGADTFLVSWDVLIHKSTERGKEKRKNMAKEKHEESEVW